MATDIEKTGVEFRVLAALSPISWNKLSFWGRAEDVIFADNTTAENKLGAITGITSDVNSVSQTLCASTYLVNYVSGEQVVFDLDKNDLNIVYSQHTIDASYLFIVSIITLM